MIVEEYINKLNQAKIDVANLESYIQIKKAEYELATKESREKLKDKKGFLGVTQFVNYTASLGEIQDSIARIIGISTDEIKVDVRCENELADYNDYPDIMYAINNNSIWGFNMVATINVPNCDSIIIRNLIITDEVQVDGRTLLEHSKVKHSKDNVSYNGALTDIYYSGIEFDDFRNINFVIPFKQIVKIIDGQYTLNILGQAINDIENARQQSESENCL